MQFPFIDTLSSLCPPMKGNCYTGTCSLRYVMLPTNISVPATQYSWGEGNERPQEHKKRRCTILYTMSYIVYHKNDENCGSCALKLYCYFRGDVPSMTTRQELAMLSLYDVSSTALYWTVQPSCYQNCEATAV